tara:strand:- start:57053 stop:58330 length:1278 start_codon:yes stop_codon:yes gene_type:complete
MKIEINNAHIVDPENHVSKVASLYIHNRSIAAVGDKPADWTADTSIDAKGSYLFPGLVDIATRLREPGYEHKATIASETYAAVSGGITSVACLPDTKPAINSPAEVELIQQRTSAAGHCRVYVIGALTSHLKGTMLNEMAALKEAGVVGVSNVLRPVANNLILRRAMEYASSQGLTLFYHPMDHSLAENGCAHEGMYATRMGLAGIPTAAETAAVGSCLALIEQTGVRVHFCRLSTQRSLQILERAKFDGVPISADISAHQLFLSDVDIAGFDGNYHVLPPLRSRTDVAGLRHKLSSEIIESICSDHQPHERDAKLAPFASTEPGISALETLLPLALQLVKEDVASLSDIISLLTYKPARLLNIKAGNLSPGQPADLCICDPAIEWKLTAENMHSRGKNTPFLNRTLKGKVTHTFVDGKLVFESS